MRWPTAASRSAGPRPLTEAPRPVSSLRPPLGVLASWRTSKCLAQPPWSLRSWRPAKGGSRQEQRGGVPSWSAALHLAVDGLAPPLSRHSTSEIREVEWPPGEPIGGKTRGPRRATRAHCRGAALAPQVVQGPGYLSWGWTAWGHMTIDKDW